MVRREWSHASKKTVAKLYRHDDIQGILTPDMIIGPNEELLLIEDGKILDSLTQTKIKKIKGGLFNEVKNFFGRGKRVEILFVDTSEKEISIPFGKDYTIAPMTQESDMVEGTVTMLFNIDRHNIANIYTHTKTAENKELTLRDIKKLLRREVLRRVLLPQISELSTRDLGSMEVIRRIENSCRRETGKRMELYAIDPIQFTIGFDLTSVQRMDKQLREKELVDEFGSREYEQKVRRHDRDQDLFQDAQDRVADRKKRSLKRDRDVDSTGMEMDHEKDIEKRYYDHKESMQDLAYRSEFEKRDAKEKAELDEYTTDYELTKKRKVTDTELDIDKSKRIHEVEMSDKEFAQDMKEMEGLLGLKAKKDELKMKKMAHMSDLKVKEYQATELQGKALEAEVEKVKAMSEAEKAKYNMKAYERALDRKDAEQNKQWEHMANIVGASKQNVPHTLVQGGQARSAVRISERDSGGEAQECPECGAMVTDGSRFCHKCGERMD